MKSSLLAAVVATVLLTGCNTTFNGVQTAQNDNFLPLIIGSVAGGLLGNQIGKGTGKTISTAFGAVIGATVGRNLSRRNTHVQRYPAPPPYPTRNSTTLGTCDHITNAGARARCEYGVSIRNREIQRGLEDRAYNCGRYGRCN